MAANDLLAERVPRVIEEIIISVLIRPIRFQMAEPQETARIGRIRTWGTGLECAPNYEVTFSALLRDCRDRTGRRSLLGDICQYVLQCLFYLLAVGCIKVMVWYAFATGCEIAGTDRSAEVPFLAA